MWFIGLIVGLVVGAAVEDFEGAFYGAALGALAGYALRLALGRSTEERLRALEQEVADLRRALRAQPLQPGVVHPALTPEEPAVAAASTPEPFPEFEIASEPTPELEPALGIEREPEPAPIEPRPPPIGRLLQPSGRPG